MVFLMPTCKRVTALLTDYREGALPLHHWLGVRLHLAACPPCRALLKAFEHTPTLLRRAWGDGPVPQAEQALASVLAALREGRVPRGPQHHPEPEAWAALEAGGDPFLALLLRVHLGHCETCRDIRRGDGAIPPGQDPLASLRPHLPPESQWRWIKRGLGGGRAAVLMEDPVRGASLILTCLPGGRCAPAHEHTGRECALILCGALQDGPAKLRTGDWIAHPSGHRHGPSADSGAECWALIALERPVRFMGWRGVIANRFSAVAPH